jgi:hypothetical protein
VSYHGVRRAAAERSQSLADVSIVAESSNLLVRLHGAFMIGAWIGAAGIGILLARYFKQTWVGSQLCGKDQWFAVSCLISVVSIRSEVWKCWNVSFCLPRSFFWLQFCMVRT